MSKFRFHIKSKNHGPVPTKDDILNALDQFGGEKDIQPNGKYPTSSREINRKRSSSKNAGHNHPLAPDVGFTEQEQKRMEYTQSVSFSNSYSDEWERLFGNTDYMRELRSLGLDGLLRSSRFRSICWRLYLDVLPDDRQRWITKTRELRHEYTELKEKLILNPRKQMEDTQDLDVNNPLSQNEESPWNKFFQDNELRLTIKQDVIRTFPELEFFQNESIRELMVNILFCTARENYGLLYRQGMHELLAPLIFVLHCDHQAFLHACELDTVEDIVKELLDPEYLEHDAYSMFCQVMETTEPWYQSREISPPTRAQAIMIAQPFARPQDMQPSNVIVNKLTRIQDYILKKHDLELHMHLERLDIAPQIYGIRWLRLLFGREFPMQDLLVIWDAIFADSISFDLVDYIFVAMLLYIRDLLLTNDYPSCLGILMRYPPVGDVHYLIDRAMYLRDPHIHPRPPNYTCQGQRFAQPQPAVNSYKHNAKNNKVSATDLASKFKASAVTGFSTLTRKINNTSTRPKTLTPTGQTQSLHKSTSEPMNLLTDTSPGQSQSLHKSTSEPMNLLTDTSPEVPKKLHNRKGSTSSLSKMESMRTEIVDHGVRSAVSAQSLARMETLSLKSSESSTSIQRMEQFSPEEPYGATASKSNTLPSNRSKVKRHRKTDSGNIQVQNDAAYVQGRINDMEAMCKYCASKMDIHIEKLQNVLLKQRCLENEDELFLAVAGIKQVRDVLKGTLRFARNVLDSDEISISDNHYEPEPKPVVDTPIDTDPASEGYTPPTSDENTTDTNSRFYVDQVMADYVNIETEADRSDVMNKRVPISVEIQQSRHGTDNDVSSHVSSGSAGWSLNNLDSKNRNVCMNPLQSEENANLFS